VRHFESGIKSWFTYKAKTLFKFAENIEFLRWIPCGKFKEQPVFILKYKLQNGARKIGPPSRRPTWAKVLDSVQEIKRMQMQSTYWLEKVLKIISLYVNALLCTPQHIVIHAMQLSGVNSENFQRLL